MNVSQTFSFQGNSLKYYKSFIYDKNQSNSLLQIKRIRLVDITLTDNKVKKGNIFILMVGGLGTKLHLLINHIPYTYVKNRRKTNIENSV